MLYGITLFSLCPKIKTHILFVVQAFIKTAGTIYKKIQDGVFDVSNEVSVKLLGFSVYQITKLNMLAWS